MREPSEIVTASRMQNIVKIRKKHLFRDHITFLNLENLEKSDFFKCMLTFLVYCVH